MSSSAQGPEAARVRGGTGRRPPPRSRALALLKKSDRARTQTRALPSTPSFPLNHAAQERKRSITLSHRMVEPDTDAGPVPRRSEARVAPWMPRSRPRLRPAPPSRFRSNGSPSGPDTAVVRSHVPSERGALRNGWADIRVVTEVGPCAALAATIATVSTDPP
jgi:hypothetical protein